MPQPPNLTILLHIQEGCNNHNENNIWYLSEQTFVLIPDRHWFFKAKKKLLEIVSQPGIFIWKIGTMWVLSLGLENFLPRRKVKIYTVLSWRRGVLNPFSKFIKFNLSPSVSGRFWRIIFMVDPFMLGCRACIIKKKRCAPTPWAPPATGGGPGPRRWTGAPAPSWPHCTGGRRPAPQPPAGSWSECWTLSALEG